jgi:predicted branched-subunit amino acid permease
MKDVATMGGMMSLVFCALLLLLYLLGAILRVKKGEWYDEYSNSLVKGNFSLGFQLICYFLWIIAGALLSFMNAFRYINACMMGIFMVLYFITLTRPIFNRPLDRYRTQLNLLTISFAQLPYLYANTHSVP